MSDMGVGVPDTTMWSPLRAAADGRDLVLTVDFGGARPEAGFAELTPLLPDDRAVLVTRPPDRVVDDAADAARQVDAWRDAVLASGARVCTVIGYCTGAAVAARLAQDLAAHGHPVGLVLVDPAVAGAGQLLAAHRDAVESLVAVLDRAPADAEATDPTPGPAPDLVELARGLAADYARTAGRVGRELDLDDELVADLVVRVRRYLSYLVVVALTAPPTPQDGPPTLTVLSAAHPPDAFPAVGGRQVRFDVPRADLLADAGVGRLLAEFVAGRPVTPAPAPGTPRR
ncbi:hypothetical protein [Micromonospora sp. DT233]|uniref:hypothetical protein n=1 Tax=Micromonospora sp. DT233 TaxID=3393432 RepID=UPI003CF94942